MKTPLQLLQAYPKVVFKNPEMTNVWGNPKIGAGTQVGAYVEIGDDVEIGRDCVIGAYAFICPKTRIRDSVWIGPRVTFTNDKYPPSKDIRGTTIHYAAVIGANATILPGLTIQMHAFVGAGSVVTRSVWAYENVRGNPAKTYTNVVQSQNKYLHP